MDNAIACETGDQERRHCADAAAGEGDWAWSEDSILPADERALVEQNRSGKGLIADTKIERH